MTRIFTPSALHVGLRRKLIHCIEFVYITVAIFASMINVFVYLSHFQTDKLIKIEPLNFVVSLTIRKPSNQSIPLNLYQTGLPISTEFKNHRFFI